jgi:hypothetical protein
LKAKAASTSITNAIKVNAENACGKSNDYSNSTALSILNCSTVPNKPGDITITPTSVVVGSNFTASIGAVTGASGYAWNTPAGLTIVSGQNTIKVTYKTSTTGTVAIGAISVYANNACGNGQQNTNSKSVAVTPPACSGYALPSGVFTPGSTTVWDGWKSLDQLLALGYKQTSRYLCVKTSDTGGRKSAELAGTECEYLNVGTESGWRLPNSAELIYMKSDPQAGTWSWFNFASESTVISGIYHRASVYYNQFDSNIRSDVSAYVRCVKSL